MLFRSDIFDAYSDLLAVLEGAEYDIDYAVEAIDDAISEIDSIKAGEA